MKKIILFVLLALPMLANAQDIVVKSFSEAPATSLGKTIGDIPKTNEGEDAAIVVVKADNPSLAFEGRLLYDEQHPQTVYDNGEYILYLAPRSKSLTVKIPGYPDAKVNVSDYPSIKDGIQSRRMYVLYLQIIPKGVVGGRNIAFGVSGGYLMPMISAGGDNFSGSVINYGTGGPQENATYSDPKGFVVGVNADIRLHNFFYLNVGLDFGQYTYSNSFLGESDARYMMTYKESAIPVNLNFKEGYKHMFIELPVLASYRYSLGPRNSIHVGVGPVLNFGLKANCKYNGELLFERYDMYQDGTGTWRAIQYSGDLDLYSDHTTINEVYYKEAGTETQSRNVRFDSSALNRLNLMAGAYVAYEFNGIQVSVHYRYMLSNAANDKYWSKLRLPILSSEVGGMQGASIKHSFLQFKIGYTLRY